MTVKALIQNWTIEILLTRKSLQKSRLVDAVVRLDLAEQHFKQGQVAVLSALIIFHFVEHLLHFWICIIYHVITAH